MASSRSTAADDTPHRDSLPRPTSEPTPTTAFQQHHTEFNTAASTPFLPGNPPIHLAPSITRTSASKLDVRYPFHACHPHPGTPFCSRSHTRSKLFRGQQRSPPFLPVPPQIVRLGQKKTLHLTRARRLLLFIPGPPGSPGQYRINPTVHFHSSTIPRTISPTPSPPSSFSFLDRSPPSAPAHETEPHTHLLLLTLCSRPRRTRATDTNTSSDFHLSGHPTNSVSSLRFTPPPSTCFRKTCGLCSDLLIFAVIPFIISLVNT